jgi:hypothetical protein
VLSNRLWQLSNHKHLSHTIYVLLPVFILFFSPSFLNSTVFQNLKYLQVPKYCMFILDLQINAHVLHFLENSNIGTASTSRTHKREFCKHKISPTPHIFSLLITLETGSNERTIYDPVQTLD